MLGSAPIIPRTRTGEAGQSLIMLALAFVGILAFVGLAIDALLVINGQAQLVRAADAAALAAATKHRQGASASDLEDIAREFLELNDGDNSMTVTETAWCGGGLPDLGLCGATPPYRRFFRVTAEKRVGLAFLRILGFNSVTLTNASVAEAAALDVMLAIDRSESMAYDNCRDNDDDDGDSVNDDCGIGQVGPEADSEPDRCNPGRTCLPFERLKEAAINFVNQLDPSFDQVGVVTFSQEASCPNPPECPGEPNPLYLTNAFAAVTDYISQLRVYKPDPCLWNNPNVGPSNCTSTNIGGGLQAGHDVLFASPNNRPDGLWVIILITDGAANTTNRLGPGAHQYDNIYCPEATWKDDGPDPDEWPEPPFCRDDFIATRHNAADPAYDADDWARDRADEVVGADILIFTIGLGAKLINEDGGDPNAGEELLRYIADKGDGIDAPQCAGKPTSTLDNPVNCGNYYFSPTSSDLQAIFDEIAGRIFTRLSR